MVSIFIKEIKIVFIMEYINSTFWGKSYFTQNTVRVKKNYF